MVKIGIVGLPNVGKSTLFNAITNSNIEAANYPFATIEPNIGVVEIKDERLDNLAKLFNSKKKIYNMIEFVDIAGLVKGASKGEGLGNKFLSNIREVDAIINLVRLFEDDQIIHVDGSISPIRDIETIMMELILSDIEQINNFLSKSERKILQIRKKDELLMLETLKKALSSLQNEIPISNLELSIEEKNSIKSFSFLTGKPFLYIANISETELKNPNENPHFNEFEKYMKENNFNYITLSSQIEFEISKLNPDEQKEFFDELGINESGLNNVSKKSFELLDLCTYFTVGEKEAHCWTFKKGMKAPEAAGIIHTDFEKGFIKAEVYSYNDIMEHKTEQSLKSVGKIRLEGKEYIVQDGDICTFRFNV